MGEETRKVRLEPQVLESWLMEAAAAGVSPNELAEYILAHADVEDWVARMRGTTANIPMPEFLQASRPPPPTRLAFGSAWTKASFESFLKAVSDLPDFTGPLSLLAAYVRLGPAPTSEQLQSLCMFSDRSRWGQELRLAKMRLNKQALRLGQQTFFPRAQTSDSQEGPKRLHPIEPQVYSWLTEWGMTSGASPLPAPEKWGPSVESATQREATA